MHRHQLTAIVVTAVLSTGLTACTAIANAAQTHPSTNRHLSLRAMPAGKVTIGDDARGNIDATVNAYGLTPGSTHAVEIDTPGAMAPLATFGTLTADGTGRAYATLDGDFAGALPAGSRFVIRLGTGSTGIATEPIAETVPLAGRPHGRTHTLHAVDVSASGMNEGPLTGRSKLVYSADAHTLTVTVTATGLTPGAHAAHIHLGSCRRQGAVKYMLMDFTANADGAIVNESRTVTGVMSPPPATGWYLNLHLGDSADILSGGQPTPAFRPLLCANL